MQATSSFARTSGLIALVSALTLATPAHAKSKSPPTPVKPADAPSTTAAPLKPTATGGQWSATVKVKGTIDDKTMTATMLVYTPVGYSATKKFPLVIALHGWNHTPEMFRDKGDLAQWADRYGVVLAVPAMGKTVYETAFYPESKRAWGVIPGTRWVGEVILPYVRANYAVLSDRAHTAVIGYSTGGRGAVLLAEAYPEFAFAGSASGTFDLMRLDPKDGEYKIHAIIYGPRDKNTARWELDNCITPARLAKLDGTALFIAHSGKDNVVMPNQLDALRAALDGKSAIKAEFVTPPAGGHDWKFWNAQWPAMFTSLAAALALPPAK